MRFTSKAYYLGILNDGAAPSEYVICSTLLKKCTPQTLNKEQKNTMDNRNSIVFFLFRIQS